MQVTCLLELANENGEVARLNVFASKTNARRQSTGGWSQFFVLSFSTT